MEASKNHEKKIFSKQRAFHEFRSKHHTISIRTTFNNLETHKKSFKQKVTFLENISMNSLHCTMNSIHCKV